MSAAIVGLYARPETCGNMNGAIYSSPQGTPPFTYSWTGPNGYTSAADTLWNLDAGTYNVMMIDAVQDTAYGIIDVEDWTDLGFNYQGPTYAGAASVLGYWGGACEGECNGAGAFVEGDLVGTGLLTYTFSVPAQWLGLGPEDSPVYGGFCYGEWVNYSFADQLGCPGGGSFTVYGVDATWYPVLDNVQGSCTGGNAGSATFNSASFGGFTMDLVLRTNGVFVTQQTASMGSPFTISDLAPGDYELTVAFDFTQCSDTLLFTIPDLGPACGNVTGTSWYDADGDCVQDAGEVGIPYSVLEVQPGGYFAITQANGTYTMNLPDGNYTLAQTDATLVPICPPAMPVPLIIAGAPVVLDLANGSTEALDLEVATSSGAARPGFSHHLYGNVVNSSPQVSGPLTLTWAIDPTLVISSATPAPTSTVGNTLTWSLPALDSFGSTLVTVHTVVPVGTPLGTLLSNTLNASTTLAESTLANNTDVLENTVTGSYDPNDKLVRTSSRQSDTQYFIGTDEYLDYTIRFQNTGTDTAFTVVITDTLPVELDLASYQQGVSSHSCTVDFLNDRVVRWTFNNILLPDSTTNEPASHGLTSFRIHVQQPLVAGTVVTNAADIFFDFNPPVRTPDAVVTVDFSTGVGAEAVEVLRLVPNPAHDRLALVGPAVIIGARITAADGRVVLDRPLMGGRTLDVGALPAGSYVVHARMADGAEQVLRFVKQ